MIHLSILYVDHLKQYKLSQVVFQERLEEHDNILMNQAIEL